jgi:two-component system phosphate regulon response regulator OmpR
VVRGELYSGGDVVHLTAAEAGLLSMLAQKAGQAVSREELSISLSGNIRNVDVQMTRLRRKIERDPRFPRYLQTVRGTGYILKPD